MHCRQQHVYYTNKYIDRVTLPQGHQALHSVLGIQAHEVDVFLTGAVDLLGRLSLGIGDLKRLFAFRLGKVVPKDTNSFPPHKWLAQAIARDREGKPSHSVGNTELEHLIVETRSGASRACAALACQ
jgi:hypothetical protein